MKFALKSLVAAAAIASVGLANAAAVTIDAGQAGAIGGKTVGFNGGSGTLAFSVGSDYVPGDVNSVGGLIGALNVGKVAISGVGGAVVEEDNIPDPFGEPGDVVRVGSKATAQVVSVTTDDVTGQVLSVQSTGGASQLGTRISGTLTGGTASVTNLRFDLANNVVYADLAGTKAAVGSTGAVNYNLPNTALWNIGSVSGPTIIDPAALAIVGRQDRIDAFVADGYTYVGELNGSDIFSAVNVISGLTVTQAGFDFFNNSLGLLATGRNALAAVNGDPQGWGSVNSQLTFAVPVPEPSTYAMLGVGLLVVGGALRARRRA